MCLHTAHMTSNVYANIHINSTELILKSVREIHVIVTNSEAPGLAHVVKNIQATKQYTKHMNKEKIKVNQ